jgi:hypothetical protein
MEQLLPFLPVVFLAFFLGVWLLVTGLISTMDGWADLAPRFRATQPFTGEKVQVYRSSLRSHGFRRSLTLGADYQGLYLEMFFMFRFRHPPLFIPWEEIRHGGVKPGLLEPDVLLYLGNQEAVPLTIEQRSAEKLRQAAGDRWPAPPT